MHTETHDRTNGDSVRETYCQTYMIRKVLGTSGCEGESEFLLWAPVVNKSAPSKIRPSTIFGYRNVCYWSAQGKADFVASIAIREIYKRVEIPREVQFISVAGEKHIHQHVYREY
jgi:hypothetical protein